MAEEQTAKAPKKRCRSFDCAERALPVRQRRAAWLATESKLIGDINRSRFSGAIADVNGVQYEGSKQRRDSHNQLSLKKTPCGIVGLPWAKVAPQALLAISTSFIKPNEADAADRLWLCVQSTPAKRGKGSRAALVGSRCESQNFPEYREQLPLLTRHRWRVFCSLKGMLPGLWGHSFFVLLSIFGARAPRGTDGQRHPV